MDQQYPRRRRGRGSTLVRALKLLRLLEDRPAGVTVTEAITALEASRRTVYRDLAALQAAGFALRSSRETGELRWFLLRGNRDLASQ